MSGTIEKYSKGRVVRFEPAGDNRWIVALNGHTFEVSQNDLRDGHGWTRHSYSLRHADKAEPDAIGIADLAAVAVLICEWAYRVG